MVIVAPRVAAMRGRGAGPLHAVSVVVMVVVVALVIPVPVVVPVVHLVPRTPPCVGTRRFRGRLRGGGGSGTLANVANLIVTVKTSIAIVELKDVVIPGLVRRRGGGRSRPRRWRP